MFPAKDLPISGPEPDYSLEVLYGEPVSKPLSLLDGSAGTQVRINQTFWDGFLTYDRFGKLVDHFQGDYGDAESFRDTLYPDGSEFHQTYQRGVGTTTVTLDADGTRIETVTPQGPFGEEDLPPTVTTTPGRTVVSQQTGTNGALETETRFYDNGDRVVEITNLADATRRVLSYEANGTVDHEQRFNPDGKLIYDVTGPANGEHSSFQVRSDGEHTTLFEGNKAVFKELAKLNGSFETFSYAAGQTHGGATGNDSFNGFKGGDDTFVFGASFGNDTIRNFEADKDTLYILPPSVDREEITLSYESLGRDTVVHVADQGVVTLKGVHIDTVSALHITSTNYDFDLMV